MRTLNIPSSHTSTWTVFPLASLIADSDSRPAKPTKDVARKASAVNNRLIELLFVILRNVVLRNDYSLLYVSLNNLFLSFAGRLFSLEVLYLEPLDIVRHDSGTIVLGLGHEAYVVKGNPLGVADEEAP